MAIARSGMRKQLFGGKKAPAKGAKKKGADKKLPPWLNKAKGGKNAK